MENKLQKKAFYLAVFILLLSANVFSQSAYNNIFSINSLKTASQPDWMRNSVDEAVILDVDKSQLQQLISRKDERIIISVPFSINNNAQIVLEKFDVTS